METKKQFDRPEGHTCCASTSIAGQMTFGTGQLDEFGFWEHGCPECAAAFKEQFPELGPVWPDDESTPLDLEQLIIKIVDDHSGGIKLTELIPEIMHYTRDRDLLSAIENLVRQSSVLGYLTYYQLMSPTMLREKAFIYRKEANNA